MSTYTVTSPTGPSPVRNLGIRATVSARAEARHTALIAIAGVILSGDSDDTVLADLFDLV